jgi:hypothetical protein
MAEPAVHIEQSSGRLSLTIGTGSCPQAPQVAANMVCSIKIL